MEYLEINGLTSLQSQAMAYGFPDAAPAALNVVVAWYWMPMPGSYITSYRRWKLKTRVSLDFKSFQRLLGTSDKGRQVTGLCTYAKGSPPHRTATCRRTQAMTASKSPAYVPGFIRCACTTSTTCRTAGDRSLTIAGEEACLEKVLSLCLSLWEGHFGALFPQFSYIQGPA